MILSWPPGIQSAFQSTLDSYLTNLRGQSCILYFPAIQPTNADYGDVSTSFWSMPEPNTLQQESALLTIQPTSIITMTVSWPPDRYDQLLPKGERRQYGFIKTRGFVQDLPAVLNCVKMATHRGVGTDHYEFKLAGEPVFSRLVPDTYFLAAWERI